MYNYSFIIYIIWIPILTSIFCAWGLTPVALRQIGETVRVIQCFRSDGTLLLGNDEVFFPRTIENNLLDIERYVTIEVTKCLLVYTYLYLQ